MVMGLYPAGFMKRSPVVLEYRHPPVNHVVNASTELFTCPNAKQITEILSERSMCEHNFVKDVFTKGVTYSMYLVAHSRPNGDGTYRHLRQCIRCEDCHSHVNHDKQEEIIQQLKAAGTAVPYEMLGWDPSNRPKIQ